VFHLGGFIKAANNMPQGRGKKRNPNSMDTEEVAAKRASVKLNEGDVHAAVRALSEEDSFVPPSVDLLVKLQSKHPPRPPDRRIAPTTSCIPLVATVQD